MKHGLLLLALVSLGLGCSKPAIHLTAVGDGGLPGGWDQMKSDTFPVSVGVAPGWKIGPAGAFNSLVSGSTDTPSNDAGQQILDSMKKAAEEDAKAQMKSLEKKGILLICNDGSRPLPGEVSTEYFLKHETRPGNLDLEEAAGIIKSDLLGASAPETLDTPLGKAAKISCEITTIAGDKVHKIVYVFVDGRELYTLRFACTGDDKIKDIAEPVMKTLRIQSGFVFPEPEASG